MKSKILKKILGWFIIIHIVPLLMGIVGCFNKFTQSPEITSFIIGFKCGYVIDGIILGLGIFVFLLVSATVLIQGK